MTGRRGRLPGRPGHWKAPNPSTLFQLVLMPRARAMLALLPVARDGMTHFGAEEPVEHADQYGAEDGADQNGFGNITQADHQVKLCLR